MFKSAKRDKAEGAVDKIGGRIMEAVGALRGREGQKTKGQAGQARGSMRKTKGRAKKAVK